MNKTELNYTGIIDHFHQLITKMDEEKDKKPIVVGVDGFAGSGKTRFSMKLKTNLEETNLKTSMIRFDTFWKGTPESNASIFPKGRNLAGNDYLWTKFKRRVLIPLHDTNYNELENSTVGSKLNPAELRSSSVIIIEGVTVLRKELIDYYDLRIFISSNRDDSLKKAIERDGEQTRNWYENYWKQEEDLYAFLHQPQTNADFVMINTLNNCRYYLIKQKA